MTKQDLHLLVSEALQTVSYQPAPAPENPEAPHITHTGTVTIGSASYPVEKWSTGKVKVRINTRTPQQNATL